MQYTLNWGVSGIEGIYGILLLTLCRISIVCLLLFHRHKRHSLMKKNLNVLVLWPVVVNYYGNNILLYILQCIHTRRSLRKSLWWILYRPRVVEVATRRTSENCQKFNIIHLLVVNKAIVHKIVIKSAHKKQYHLLLLSAIRNEGNRTSANKSLCEFETTIMQSRIHGYCSG